ncbi:hypothetical protein BCR34DRAFT_79377 [Clohesyomyces aquaticus]|uniref:Uncharacterized protein n=1 Tax=Clohesyomyces aquaticus TaxID=1231657 RepID=A0A1Y1YXN8_9PLEO|nr:hypothetical protein BCR34DRAFT_79377 [Clohesyomyces aquaticus]
MKTSAILLLALGLQATAVITKGRTRSQALDIDALDIKYNSHVVREDRPSKFLVGARERKRRLDVDVSSTDK